MVFMNYVPEMRRLICTTNDPGYVNKHPTQDDQDQGKLANDEIAANAGLLDVDGDQVGLG